MSFQFKPLKLTFLPIIFCLIYFCGGGVLLAEPMENDPVMLMGMFDEKPTIGYDILQALRASIFIALCVLSYTAIKQKNKMAIFHAIGLIGAAILSFVNNENHYASTPDFSYLTSFYFVVLAITIYASFEYLRSALVSHYDKFNMFDNAIMVVGVLGISFVGIISLKSPIMASNIILFSWCGIVFIGTLWAIYSIVERQADIDLTLMGWLPIQVAFIIALGVSANSGAFSVFASIAAWSTVIIGHGFLAFLTYYRFKAPLKHTALSVNQPFQSKDSVSFIVDKAVFRVQSDKKKVILNQISVDMLKISGNNYTFSMNAFKGLVDKKYHNVIDKMMNNTLEAPEYIKFHVCPKAGFIQPLQFQLNDSQTDILFLYQQMDTLQSISSSYNKTNNASHASLERLEATSLMKKSLSLKKQNFVTSSEMMFFIEQLTDIVQNNYQKKGCYNLLLLEVKYYDDWQVILGLSYTYQLIQQVTDIIKKSLTEFDGLFVKSINGNMVGIFCHFADNYDLGTERLKGIIAKKFETPISMNDYKIFVNFIDASDKILLDNIHKGTSQEQINYLITQSMDNVWRNITLNRDSEAFDTRKLTLPTGSNLIRLASDLRYAPERDQIHAYYTPMIDLSTGNVIGFNVDPVWRHPNFNLIQGDLLSYLTERCKMENTLNRLVIAKSIEGMVQLYREKKFPIISFTISKNRLLTANLDVEIKDLCEVLHISPSLIRLEFSPECLAENSKWFAEKLTDIKAIGVTTVLSDFGASKGQLSSLAQFAFDRVIIDSAFSENIVHDERHFFALKSLASMLENMSIKVDMKNVNSSKGLKKLAQVGISNISGNAIGTMIPAERAVNLLTKNYEIN